MAAVDVVADEFEVVTGKASKEEKIGLEDYKRVHCRINKIPGIGCLLANHLIGIAVIVGVLPLSLFSFIDGGAKKFYEGLEKHFKEQNKTRSNPDEHYTLPPKAIVLENVRFLTQTVFEYKYIH